jgi:hypothetical protein
MENLKIYTVQMLALFSTFLISSIVIYSYIKLELLNVFHQGFNPTISSIFFLIVSIYIIIANSRIPFVDYNVDEEFDVLFVEEVNSIVTHLFISFIISSILVISMYLVSL